MLIDTTANKIKGTMVDEALIKRTDIVWFTDFIFYRALCTPDYTFPGLIINPQP